MPDKDLERHRNALLLLARAQLARHPRLNFDASDLVQEALLQGARDAAQFRGGTEVERFAWLRTILHNRFLDLYAKAHAVKRDVARQAFEADLTGSFAGLDELLAAKQTSPSERAVRNEELERLAAALEQLSEEQRDAITLKDLVGLPLAEVAGRMRRSEAAVAGLLFRGRLRLKELMARGASS
jgi:RNA polymerase sigma-70 factor (ECF subfamily)